MTALSRAARSGQRPYANEQSANEQHEPSLIHPRLNALRLYDLDAALALDSRLVADAGTFDTQDYGGADPMALLLEHFHPRP